MIAWFFPKNTFNLSSPCIEKYIGWPMFNSLFSIHFSVSYFFYVSSLLLNLFEQNLLAYQNNCDVWFFGNCLGS